jgi:hypothetical protein
LADPVRRPSDCTYPRINRGSQWKYNQACHTDSGWRSQGDRVSPDNTDENR